MIIKKLKLTHSTIAILAILLFGTTYIAQGQGNDKDENAIVWSTDNNNLKWGPCPAFMGKACNISVLHGNPKNPNTDIFFKMEGNTSVPRHWHNSPERMVLITGKMRVDYDGQDAETINTGDYAYGPAERPHSASCISDEPCVLFIAFINPIDAMPGGKNE